MNAWIVQIYILKVVLHVIIIIVYHVSNLSSSIMIPAFKSVHKDTIHKIIYVINALKNAWLVVTATVVLNAILI